MVNLQVTIRQGGFQDFDAIATLVNRSFEIERSYLKEPPETAASVADDIKSGLYCVAVDSQRQLVGCVYIHNRHRAIFKLAVEPALQRKGIGRRLMAGAEEYAKSAGWPQVAVSFLSVRTELLEYYHKQGYAETGEERKLARPACAIQPCHLTIMSKKLI